MSILNVITLLGAIATFLFGMNTMSDGLERLSGGRLERILEKLTSNVFRGVALGALVTALIQSSSATTVMCVGFVNAGIMKFSQTIGIIMGANIGTTMTAQLLRLGDISSDNPFLVMLKPSTLGPLMAAIGIVLYMFMRGTFKRNVGQILLGFGLLFISMKTIETAVSPLQDMPEFSELFLAFSNPVLGVLVGAFVTAAIQSSSASVGILQALSSTGVISFNIAAPLIFGQNIGTCITAILSSIGASKNAKRTAALHLLFNLLGTTIFLVALYAGNALFNFSFWTDVMDRSSIANFHLIFNVSCTIVLLPFHKLITKLVERLVPADAESVELSVLDERFLATPAIALDKSREAVLQMGTLAQKNFRRSVELLEHYDSKKVERLQETENALDKLQDTLDNYLIQLTNRTLSAEESMAVSELLHTLSDFERVGDYAVNISETAAILHERNIIFSDSAKKELLYMSNAVGEVIDRTVQCCTSRSTEDAFAVEPLEEVVDLMRDRLKTRHVERLKAGECTVELGTQFLELLINFERISDHCSNVAIYILRQTGSPLERPDLDAHAYTHFLHQGGNPQFEALYTEYRSKYYLPIRIVE